MSAHPPPVPPANRSPKGTGESVQSEAERQLADKPPQNTDEQGRQGNVKQNTTNRGLQQDR